MKILGIDNGISGAMVMLEDNRVIGRLVMPTIPAPNGKGNEYDIATILMALDSWKPERAVIERAQAMRLGSEGQVQGVVSTFNIGKNYGIMLGILAAKGIAYEVVHPKTWQKMLFDGIAKDDTKAASAIVAQRLWPGVDWRATERCKKPHDGLTDAACIAEYGRRRF